MAFANDEGGSSNGSTLSTRRASSRVRGGFAAICILAAWSPAPAQRAPSDIEQWERMTAASPQRELARSWERCVAAVSTMMLPQRGTVSQFRELGIGGCAAQQSRLTGALVREFGYDRANRVVAARVAALVLDYERRAAERDNPQLPPNAVERTADGWVIQLVNGACAAHLFEQTSFGTRATILSVISDREFLLFREYGGDVQARARFMRD